MLSWCFCLDHWTRKPLLFIAFPLALIECSIGLLLAKPARLLTFDYWDFHYRMWWVAWDGTLISKKNATHWWFQRKAA